MAALPQLKKLQKQDASQQYSQVNLEIAKKTRKNQQEWPLIKRIRVKLRIGKTVELIHPVIGRQRKEVALGKMQSIHRSSKW